MIEGRFGDKGQIYLEIDLIDGDISLLLPESNDKSQILAPPASCYYINNCNCEPC
jgi:hypothetical protein